MRKTAISENIQMGTEEKLIWHLVENKGRVPKGRQI